MTGELQFDTAPLRGNEAARDVYGLLVWYELHETDPVLQHLLHECLHRLLFLFFYTSSTSS
ncbi:MAG: hypothetical protein JWO48_2658 [Bryobacterales bacterium]|nr:hypothetical protein [Bryobacterales bacterium]